MLVLCRLQLDKAAADASEYKAGYDKVLADSAEQKAQVCRLEACGRVKIEYRLPTAGLLLLETWCLSQ